eukprot:CAMPEP_0197653552 /NCGR_PEP_ID=MMETSP1338-20131121/36077_1 /TAXON_ID=43686 ORGANISM="Pelagodinium beii, Strain RCC1491" /NCGR_SAMPLE_ID=MMETSP1338 /ASSEMBLY_ACC=CAM_ASM_000754 /LENGTH=112 /DNA_ID=CAMNT_0043228707 /DNA_START=58 /DNA_END=396 /DNA_ORIENTATION=+
MSVSAAPFTFYIQNPDGTLTLQTGTPPPGYVQINTTPAPVTTLPAATSMVATQGFSYPTTSVAGFPAATSMVATPAMTTPAPAAVETPAPVTTTATKPKKKSSKKKKSGCCN